MNPPVIVDAEPFDLDPGAAPAAALCVHGFTGTPYEMRGIGEALFSAGIRARGIRLPGHERSEALAAVTRDDWRRAVREAYAELRACHERVALVGMSMGGVLSLDLAATGAPPPDAVVTLAAPMFLYGWKTQILLPVLGASPLGARLRWTKESPGNIKDAAARSRHPSLRWAPLSALNELRNLVHETRRKLSGISAPLLIAHSRYDTTALVASADIIDRGVRSRVVEKIILTDSYHVITVDRERERVETDVVRFLRTHLLRHSGERETEVTP